MADSTTNLDLVSQSQSGKEITINGMLDAASPATLFGRRQSTCSGLTWGFYGGMHDVNHSATVVGNGTLTLIASQTNYIVALLSDGVVSTSTTTTNWLSSAYKQLYIVTTGPTTATSYIDYRRIIPTPPAVRVVSIATTTTALVDINITDTYNITALATSCTFLNPIGDKTDDQALIYRIKDNGIAKTLAWDVIFVSRGNALPLTTIAGKYLRVIFLYNADTLTWDCISTVQEA